MSLGLHPVILIAALGVLLALIAVGIAFIVRSSGLKVLMIGVAVICLLPGTYFYLALNPELVDRRFRTYKKFYDDIQVGMTREQVLEAMERRYPVNGLRQRPRIMDNTAVSLGFFMNPESSREPNCEGIFLTLESNRVSKKVYSRD